MTRITQLLRRGVQINPRGLATEYAGRRQDWTCFADRASRLAGALAGLGFRPGDRIGILALNSDRYMECFYGFAWGGVVFVPINTRLAPPEIVYWLTDSGCTGLVVDDAFVAVLPALRAATEGLRHVIHIGDAPLPAGLVSYEALIAAASPAVDADDYGDGLLGIYYTGGTTGRSKGVMLSHANIVANVMNFLAELPMDTDSCYLHAPPMFHIADGCMTFAITAVGGGNYFLPRFDAGDFLRTVASARITHQLLVPTMINMVVSHPEAMQHDLSSLRYMLYGASPMPEAVIRRAVMVMPRVKFSHVYGQTETAPLLTWLPSAYHDFEGANAGLAKSAGRAVVGVELRVVDTDDQPVPAGTVGEVCARGDNIMLGYWQQPEITAHTMRGGWLHTGDGGYMDDQGFLFIVDRVKDMIITGGENVYSAEVEEALYAHPAVAECAVIGIPDPEWGERCARDRSVQAGGVGDRGRADDVLPRQHRQFQDPAQHHAARGAATAVGGGQDIEDRTAQAVLGRL